MYISFLCGKLCQGTCEGKPEPLRFGKLVWNRKKSLHTLWKPKKISVYLKLCSARLKAWKSAGWGSQCLAAGSANAKALRPLTVITKVSAQHSGYWLLSLGESRTVQRAFNAHAKPLKGVATFEFRHLEGMRLHLQIWEKGEETVAFCFWSEKPINSF